MQSNDKLARLQEVADRGLQDKLPPEKKAAFDELVRRGAIRVKSPEPDEKGPSDSYILNFIREGLQGLTLNTADEIGAATAAMMAKITDGADFTDTYSDMKSLMDAEQEAFRKENPKAAIGANIGGALLTGGAGLSRLAAATAAAKPMARVAGNVGLGTTEGGIAGYAGGDGEDRIAEGIAGATFGGVLGGAGGEAFRFLDDFKTLKREVRELLDSGSTDTKVARYVKSGNRGIKKDPVAIEAINQGADEGMIAAIKGSSAQDKANMRRMLAVTRRGKENALEEATTRHTDVIGESLASRISTVQKAKRDAGQSLTGIARRELAGRQVDTLDAWKDLRAGLDGLDIRVTPDGLDFSQSALRNPQSKSLIEDAVNTFRKNPSDGYALHKLKLTLDDSMSYGKTQGLAGRAEAIVGKFRSDINNALRNASDDYAKVNETYYQTKRALDNIQLVSGKSVDLADPRSLGTVSRSVLSNIRSNGALVSAIRELDDVAGSVGGKFGDDITTQVLFSVQLDKLFGTPAKTSLEGTLNRSLARKAASGGVKEAALDIAEEMADKARGINQEAAFKALDNLLK